MLKSDFFSDERRDRVVKQINNWLGDMIRNKQLPPSKSEAALDDSDPMSLPTGGSYELGEQFLMACLNDAEIHAVCRDPTVIHRTARSRLAWRLHR